MEEEKNIGLCIWKNFYNTIKMLPKKEQQGLALAILDYAFSGEAGELTLMQKLALEPMKPSLKVRSFGGAPKGNSNAKKTTVDTTVDLKQNNSYSTVDTTNKTTVKTNKHIHIQNNTKQYKENNLSNDKLKETELENKKNIKKNYGEFCKVKLSEDEYLKLEEIYGSRLSEAIQILDDYIAQRGDKYKSHYAVLKTNNWVYDKIFKEKKTDGSFDNAPLGCGNRPEDCYL